MTEETVGEFSQELTSPVEDTMVKFDKLFYLLGAVTHPSTVKSSDETPESPIQRSLMTRNVRTELLKQFWETPKKNYEKRKRIIAEAHEWDRLAKQFLKQAEVKVKLPNLGEQIARYNLLTPQPQEKVEEKRSSSPPIVIIPGISNDLDCIASIAESLARSGRTVISVGYPESYMGKPTKEFADAIVQQKNFVPHAAFFQGAINAIVGNDSSVELWGLSTGGPIVAQILNDKSMSERVSRAVLISPVACVDQSNLSMSVAAAGEVLKIMKRYGDIAPKFVMTTGRKEGATKELSERRSGIFSTIYNIFQHNHQSLWNNMHVRDKGNIVVIAGGDDDLTKAYKAETAFSKNPQVKFAIVPGEFHASSFQSPTVLNRVTELQ